MATTTTTRPGSHGADFRDTACEGVVIRTLSFGGRPVDQSEHVVLGFRNYGEAIAEANRLRADSRDKGGHGWWLAFEAAEACHHLEQLGLPVPPELDRLANRVTVQGL